MREDLMISETEFFLLILLNLLLQIVGHLTKSKYEKAQTLLFLQGPYCSAWSEASLTNICWQCYDQCCQKSPEPSDLSVLRGTRWCQRSRSSLSMLSIFSNLHFLHLVYAYFLTNLYFSGYKFKYLRKFFFLEWQQNMLLFDIV